MIACATPQRNARRGVNHRNNCYQVGAAGGRSEREDRGKGLAARRYVPTCSFQRRFQPQGGSRATDRLVTARLVSGGIAGCVLAFLAVAAGQIKGWHCPIAGTDQFILLILDLSLADDLFNLTAPMPVQGDDGKGRPDNLRRRRLFNETLCWEPDI
jgi:hypothetical protein